MKNLSFDSLDIGCGWNQAFQRKRGTLGIDVKKGFCDIQADAQFLPLKNGIFSKTYLIDILEHLEDPVKCMKEVNRISKREATIFIRVPIHANASWIDLKRVFVSFPFGLIDTFISLNRRRTIARITGERHITSVKPKDIARIFTISRITKEEVHSWFSGKKGVFLSRLLNNFVMYIGENWTIRAQKKQSFYLS